MVLPQRTSADEAFSVVPSVVAVTAGTYQRLRDVEREYLAVMACHNLLVEWPPEVLAIVIEARAHVREANTARQQFRQQVREFVVALRAAREPLSAVLRHARSMVQLLETMGAIQPDNGWFEAEVLEWAIEEYESAA